MTVRANTKNRGMISDEEKFSKNVRLRELSKINNKTIIVTADMPTVVSILLDDEITVTSNYRQISMQDGVIIIDKADIDGVMESILNCNLVEAISKFFRIFEGDTNWSIH